MTDALPDFSELATDQTTLQRWIVTLCFGCLALFIWAAVASLDVVSIAPGEVIPADKIQSVGHLEGGVISEVYVKQGDLVAAGQALVELESTASGANVAEISLKMESLRADLWRMDAELAGADTLGIAPAISAELAAQAQALFEARRQNLTNDMKVQQSEVVRREQAKSRIQARLFNQKQRLQLLDEQIQISAELVEQEIASRYEHINLLKEASALRSQIDEDEEALLGAIAEISQAEAADRNILVKYRQELTEAHDLAQRTLNELNERYKKFADDLSRTTIIAPVSGVVKQVYLFTRGGVVAPGQTILDIVPDKSRVVIEARLAPQDIGYIDAGVAAIIRLNSVDAIKFEALTGEVVTISPDTLVDDQGNAYYAIQIATEQNYFRRADSRYPLVPGVMVTAGLVLGQRSVLSYIFAPFINSSYFVMSER